MISWDLLNNIIETRVEVPLKTILQPMCEEEKTEIELYEQIKHDVFEKIVPNWDKEDLHGVANRARTYLSSTYEKLSQKSVDTLVNNFYYNYWK